MHRVLVLAIDLFDRTVHAGGDRDMGEDWKATLHEYVRALNQAEVDGDLTALRAVMADEQQILRQEQRIDRLVRQYQQRGLTRQRREIRVNVRGLKATPDQVKVILRLNRSHHYTHHKREIVEQSRDQDQLVLQLHDRVWRVASVKYARDGQEQEANVAAITGQRLNEPYLHPHLRQIDGVNRKQAPGYDREAATLYAEQWWDKANPNYLHLGEDCANFVSQCLYAGSGQMDYTSRKDRGWWYGRKGGVPGWSYSWSVAHSLQWYLADPAGILRAVRVKTPTELEIGDVIIYDWNGTGHYGHSAIVAAKDGDGQPLVNAHTVDSHHRFWDYQDSYAWTEQTRYRFFHIASISNE